MKIWHHTLEAAPACGPCVVTMGIFDGIHVGHQALLRDARARATARGVPAALVTFDPHPAVIVAPDQRPRLLMTLAQRLAAFEAAGMDIAWVIPFSRAFSESQPEVFLRHIRRVFSPLELHVGRGFRFGRNRIGSVETLKTWGGAVGCEVHTHALHAPDGGRLSSTRIREALDAGDVEAARALLGHPYALTGVVVEGERRGRHLGFPTANLAWEQEQLPANGVYVTCVRGPHQEAPRLGLTNVGIKPTFSGLSLTVETHLPDFDADLYGVRLELGFRHRIRGECAFPDRPSLVNQITSDVAEGRRWWLDHPLT